MQTYLSLLQKEIIYEKTVCYSAVKIQLIKIKYYKNKLMLHKNTETWEIIKHFLWNNFWSFKKTGLKKWQ